MSSFKTPFAESIQPDAETEARQTAADLRRAQEEEYGQYVAADYIRIGNAMAFHPGHAVPASSVSDDGPVYPSQVVPSQQQKRQAPAKAPAKDAG